MPLGIPYQVDGISLALSARIEDWGTDVHVKAPAHATSLSLPGGASAVAHRAPSHGTRRPAGAA